MNMAKVKLPVVTITDKGGNEYVLEGTDATSVLAQVTMFSGNGVQFKVEDKLVIITKDCLCKVEVTGEVEIEVPDISCEPVECIPISGIIPAPNEPQE